MYNSNFTELTTIVKPGNTTFIQANGIARVNLWDKTKTYPSGALVLHAGYLYSATQAVDSGIDIGNTRYWQCLTYPIVDLATRLQTLSDNKLDKLTDATYYDQAYIKTSHGAQSTIDIASGTGAQPNRLARYDNKTTLLVNVIDDDGHDQCAVNRGFVKDKLSTKLDKITDAYQIYATGKNGEQSSYAFSSSAIPETILFREFGSGTCNIADPIEPSNIANKKYVDDGLSGKLDRAINVSEILYGTDEYGDGTAYYKFDSAATGWTMVYRNGDGTSSIADPIKPLNIANKQYVDTGLDGKLDKVTTAYKIYGTDEKGNQNPYTTGYSPTAGNIQIIDYTPNGGYRDDGSFNSNVTGTYMVGIPKKPSHATPKKWVEDNFTIYKHIVSFRVYDNMFIDGKFIVYSSQATPFTTKTLPNGVYVGWSGDGYHFLISNENGNMIATKLRGDVQTQRYLLDDDLFVDSDTVTEI